MSFLLKVEPSCLISFFWKNLESLSKVNIFPFPPSTHLGSLCGHFTLPALIKVSKYSPKLGDFQSLPHLTVSVTSSSAVSSAVPMPWLPNPHFYQRPEGWALNLSSKCSLDMTPANCLETSSWEATRGIWLCLQNCPSLCSLFQQMAGPPVASSKLVSCVFPCSFSVTFLTSSVINFV